MASDQEQILLGAVNSNRPPLGNKSAIFVMRFRWASAESRKNRPQATTPSKVRLKKSESSTAAHSTGTVGNRSRKEALRKNLTDPPVLLGFCERRFPGTAAVWRRQDSPGANGDWGFRSIQALLGATRATQRTSAYHALGFWPRAGHRYATAADVGPSGLRRMRPLEGGSP
jgi:hypothetical protein